jgi:hypothetical protein
MTLFEAHQILKGARPPGDTRGERDLYRDMASRVFRSACVYSSRRSVPTLSPAQWEDLANHDVTDGKDDRASLLAPHYGEQMLKWIAGAPEQYAGLAVDLGISRVLGSEERLFWRLLCGEAGPYARAAVPGSRFTHSSLQHALLQLPQQELEAITAPHAGDWPCYADRMIASSATWTHRKYEDLFKSLCRIAPNHAAECAVWNPVRHVFCATPIQLLARLPPSPQMLEIVERFGKPEVVRELLAAQVGRQLSTEMPRQDDDALPQAEMI